MLNFTSRTNFYICSIPTDMRKGREGLATIVREHFHRDPTTLKRLDENQVERLFSKKHASLADFHQALTKELELKAAALESAVASLKDENKAIIQETLKNKSETKKLREERERMSEELLQKKHELDQLKTRRK